MRNYKRLQYFLITFVFVNFECCAQILTLNLNEGDVCNKGQGKSTEHVCRNYTECTYLRQEIRRGSRPPICSFSKNTPIICCPPKPSMAYDSRVPPMSNSTPLSLIRKRYYSAIEMCNEYSKLIFTRMIDPVLLPNSRRKPIKIKNCVDIKPLIVGGQKTEPKEFPHMALLGYQETAADNSWNCGGSVISKRWILTAAHCEKVQGNLARWARLGELDYSTDADNTVHKDYRIEQRVIHPDYHGPSRYNDIALFGLDEDIEFSAYVRPICLNTDYSIQSTVTVATGWGTIDSGLESSIQMLKVSLDIFPVDKCKSVYKTNKKTYSRGIEDDSMMCVGVLNGGKDTCWGDSGGPIQIQNHNYTCMYTQIGITSFGSFCGQENTPSIYTRVSKYVPWIENIVWPRN